MVRRLTPKERLDYDVDRLMRKFDLLGTEEDVSVVSDEGRFEVIGNVFTGDLLKIETDFGITNVINEVVGYEMIDRENGEKFYAEKTEAVFLVDKYGSINASIQVMTYENDDKNTVSLSSVSRDVYFGSDERITPVFKLNEKYKMIRPLEISIDLDLCTHALLEVINDYKSNKGENLE